MGKHTENAEVFWRRVSSPLGDIALIADDRHLFAVEFLSADDALLSGSPGDNPVLREAERQLAAYFKGGLREFDLPLQPVGTDFQLSVWEAMRQIPFGRVITYGELAGAVGDRKKARAVGQAANRNPLAIVIPCHRVIGSNGRLVGYGGGLDKKELLLRQEGVDSVRFG
jgi:methylated-DNA-[protein]-cysteine S-methyltransferase